MEVIHDYINYISLSIKIRKLFHTIESIKAAVLRMGRMKRALRYVCLRPGRHGRVRRFGTSRRRAPRHSSAAASPAGTQNSPALSGAASSGPTSTARSSTSTIRTSPLVGATPTNLTASLPGDQFLEDIDRGSVVFTNTKPGAASSDILLIDASTQGGDQHRVRRHHGELRASGHLERLDRLRAHHHAVRHRSRRSLDQLVARLSGHLRRAPRSASRASPATSSSTRTTTPIRTSRRSTPASSARAAAPPSPSPPSAASRTSTATTSSTSARTARATIRSSSTASRAPLRRRRSPAPPRPSRSRASRATASSGATSAAATTTSIATTSPATSRPRSSASAGVDETLGDIDGDRVVYQTSAQRASSSSPSTARRRRNLPPGCDPAKTDLVDGAVTMTQPSRRPVYASRHSSRPWPARPTTSASTTARPTARTATGQVMVTVDGGVVLTPADFKPEKTPPAHVAAQLVLRSHARPRCVTTVPGASARVGRGAVRSGAGTITVCIRVAK